MGPVASISRCLHSACPVDGLVASGVTDGGRLGVDGLPTFLGRAWPPNRVDGSAGRAVRGLMPRRHEALAPRWDPGLRAATSTLQQRDELGVERIMRRCAACRRDAQPVGPVAHRDCVGRQLAELGCPHAGPGQHLDHQAIAGQAVGLGCATVWLHPRQRGTWAAARTGWDVPVEDRLRWWASGQSHSMRRSKKIRIIRSR